VKSLVFFDIVESQAKITLVILDVVLMS